MLRNDIRRRSAFRIGRGFHLSAVILLVSVLGLVPTTTDAQIVSEGERFTLVVPYLSPSDRSEREIIRLILTSELGSNVRLTWKATGFSRSVFVPAGTGIEEVLDTLDLVLPDRQARFNRTLRIEADRPVTASVLLDRGTASEGYSLIADRFLGFDHVIVAGKSRGLGSFATIAAIEDDTRVEITPSVPTINGNPPGQPFAVTLDAGEVYQVRSIRRTDPAIDDDLGGTRITSDRPVFVTAGATCTTVPVGSQLTCNPLLESIPRLSALGSEHIFTSYPDEQTTFLRVAAACGESTVSNVDLLPNFSVDLESKAQRIEVFGQGRVIGTEPYLAVHTSTNLDWLSPSERTGSIGDPVSSLLVPVDQMGREFRLFIPFLAGRTSENASAGWNHWVILARPDLTTTATIDGIPVTFDRYRAFVEIEPRRTYRVSATGPISVHQYGRSLRDAYSWAMGHPSTPFPLVADTVEGLLCPSGLDTIITVTNRSDAPVTIDSARFLNGIEGGVLLPLPVTVGPGESIAVPIRLEGAPEGLDGRLIFLTSSCPQTVMAMRILMESIFIEVDPPAGSLLVFDPVLPPDVTADTTITITNRGSVPVTVTDLVQPEPRFILLDSAPFVLAPGESRTIRVRFEPGLLDTVVASRLSILIDPCPDDSLFVDIRAELRLYELIDPDSALTICDPIATDTIVASIINRRPAPLRIDRLSIGGDHPSDFTLLLRSITPTTISIDDTLMVPIIFSPTEGGDRSAVLEVFGSDIGLDPGEIPLSGRFRLTRFDVTSGSLDFGVIDCAGEDIERTIRLRNTGSEPLDRLSIRWLNGDRFEIARDGPDVPLPDEVLDLRIRPVQTDGDFRDTIEIHDSTCGSRLLVPVSVRCFRRGKITLRLSDTVATVGVPIGLPLVVKRDPVGYASGIGGEIEATITYDPNVLALREASDGAGWSVVSSTYGRDGDLATITVRLQREDGIAGPKVAGIGTTDDLGDEFVLLDAIPLLGPVEGTLLDFEESSILFDDEALRPELSTVDGSVRLIGYCDIGSHRSVRSSGRFGLRLEANPVDAELIALVDLVEDSGVEIVLYSRAGTAVLPVYSGSPGSGRWRIAQDVSSLAAGLYFLELRTATQTITLPVLVL